MNLRESRPSPFEPPPSPFQAPEAAALTPGSLIQHYELIRELGRGGMGTVYLARDTRLGRRVAIKFLHTQDADIARRFLLEARATALCSHENIVIIHEVGECEHGPFMVLEYLQGQSLKKLLSQQRLPPVRAVELMIPVVRALQCAHEQGIVHRDLKPDNIFVTGSGALKVLDFGIAKVLQGSEVPEQPEGTWVGALLDDGKGEITRHGVILGTMAFMAPEQWGNGISIDHRADIWAVGIMLFRMLSGQHPLGSLGGAQLAITALLDEPMPRLRDVAPYVPAELAAVVDRCLLKRKEERFPDAASLLRALEPLLPGRYQRELRVDESPYAGLSSFQESDADRFFGRTREIAALVNRIQDQPLMAVVGPSGTGKSSFVRAGLVPVLKRSGAAWEALVIRPGRAPLSALAHMVAPLTGSSNSIEEDLAEQQKTVERLRAEPGYVGSVLRSHARRGKKKLLLFVDQFEELYTLVPDAAERRAFTACLSGLADDATSPIRVILSLRSDFLDRVPEDERFMAELGQGLYFLTPPQQDGLRDALVQPAEMAGYRFETPALVDNMLEYLTSAQGSLPLLQFAATQLWEARDTEHKRLTVEAYRAMGGIAGALASHADSVLAGLSTQERTLVRALFLRLVTPERTRAIVSVDELWELTRDSAETQRLVDQLVQARLLVMQTGSGATGATVELVHESLLHSWPTLKKWLDEGQEDSAFLEQLRTAARQWQAKKQDSNLLWRGELAQEAARFQKRFLGELPQVQHDFLAAVSAQAKKGKRLKRTLMLGCMTFLGLLVAAGAVALVVIRQSQQEAEYQAAVAQAAEATSRSAAVTAREAETEAKKNLAIAREKEQERQAALAAQEAANERIQNQNEELQSTLHAAEVARQRARLATIRARKGEKAALQAKTRATQTAQELDRALKREKDRVERLQTRTGPFMVELKERAN